jgi:ABC-2 type transport system permease protein
MSTLAIARKDFRDAIQSWLLIGVTAVFVVFAAGATWFHLVISSIVGAGPQATSSASFVRFLSNLCVFFIPLIGLIVGYKSIVGERETGSLQLLLSFPHTRRDVVIGKLIGRTTIVAISAIIGFLFAVGVIVALSGSFSPVNYVVFVILSIVLGLVFVSIAVGFSAGTRSSTRALVGAVVIFVLFYPIIWTLIPFILRFVLNEYTPLELDLTAQPEWMQFFIQFNPGTAYTHALGAVIPNFSKAANNTPFYLSEAFGFVVLAFWIIVPLALGYYRFNTTDL